MNDLRTFGRFTLDVTKKVLWYEGTLVNLTPKEIDILCLLTEKAGDVVTKDELLNRVWLDSHVEESNLTNHIYRLRKTLKSYGENAEIIQTVPRRGYRFDREINAAGDQSLVIEKHSVTRTSVEIEEESSSTFWRGIKIAVAVAIIGTVFVLAGTTVWNGRAETSVASAAPSGAGTAVPSQLSSEDRSLTELGHKLAKPQAIIRQNDGKIVLGGWSGDAEATSDIALARYNSDLTLDTTFDGDGKVTTSLGERTDLVYGLAIQNDGKIIAVGVSFLGPIKRQIVVLRYKSDGSLDASFDADGVVRLTVGESGADTANAVAIQPDGKIVVAASAWMLVDPRVPKLSQNDFCVIRLNEDGSLDTSFGDAGKVITDFGLGSDVPYSIVLQSDGKIVIAGMTGNGMNQDFGLARYHSDGRPDLEFGKAGIVRTDFFDEDDIINSITVGSDGDIFAVGHAIRAGRSDIAIARYSSDGSLSNKLDDDGRLTIDINGNDSSRSIFIDDAGRSVLSILSGIGSTNVPSTMQCGVVRLLPDGRLDPDFSADSRTRISFGDRCQTLGLARENDRDALISAAIFESDKIRFGLLRVDLGN